jgi:hypothetical protein
MTTDFSRAVPLTGNHRRIRLSEVHCIKSSLEAASWAATAQTLDELRYAVCRINQIYRLEARPRISVIKGSSHDDDVSENEVCKHSIPPGLQDLRSGRFEELQYSLRCIVHAVLYCHMKTRNVIPYHELDF